MRILHNAAIPSFRHLAHEPESPWAVRAFGELVPPATLQEARAGRDALAALLSRERAASADFLLALADFDRRRGWERLGHASLFAFLSRELGLSNGAAYLRSSAARLLPRFPAVEAALREGRLCLSAVGELARVLTAANEAAVLPRYFGCSAREAREVTAALLPRADPPRREVVTRVAGAPSKRTEALAAKAPPSDAPLLSTGGSSQGVAPADEHVVAAPARAPEPQLRAHEVEPTQPARVPRTAAIPLTADLRRLHLTVTAGFLEKVGTARTGLSHAMPGATIEQVLEAAIEALLEKQAGRKGLGKRALERSAETNLSTPRPLAARDGERARTSEPGGSAQEAASRPPEALPRLDLSRPERPHVPASLERAVRLRDGDRCQFPLDAGGVCGSTWQVELDHVRPFALGGETSLANLRCLCRRHNQAASRAALGSAAVEIRRRVLAAGSLGGRLRGAAPATTNRESVVRVQATGPGMADG